MESKFLEKAGLERAASRHRRQIRQRRDRQERENWLEGRERDLPRTASPVSDELDANPRDAARLMRSRQQIREGKVRFWPADGGDQKKSGAGG